mmetsp:Transcript_58459/g.154163  ORF Transcript_58459/g.154163 Transcript_58459/m.154163 type:complete len:83 (-) Transcript_58459:482-730(-)
MTSHRRKISEVSKVLNTRDPSLSYSTFDFVYCRPEYLFAPKISFKGHTSFGGSTSPPASRRLVHGNQQLKTYLGHILELPVW